jgi:hypothetical protein
MMKAIIGLVAVACIALAGAVGVSYWHGPNHCGSPGEDCCSSCCSEDCCASRDVSDADSPCCANPSRSCCVGGDVAVHSPEKAPMPQLIAE